MKDGNRPPACATGSVAELGAKSTLGLARLRMFYGVETFAGSPGLIFLVIRSLLSSARVTGCNSSSPFPPAFTKRSNCFRILISLNFHEMASFKILSSHASLFYAAARPSSQ